MSEPEPEPRPAENDDRLASWLVAYDDALAAGKSGVVPAEEAIPAADHDRWRRAKECVDLLNGLWPQAPPSTSGRAEAEKATVDDFAKVGRDIADLPTAPAPPPRLPEPAPGARLLDVPGFQILDEIGRGGMGIVYRALQLRLNRLVAIKALPPHLASEPERLARFRNEAEVAARLTDSSILPVFDILDCSGTPVLVAPFIEGCDLAKLIADRRAWLRGERRDDADIHPWTRLPEPEYLAEILGVLDRVVAAVAVVHQAGIIHRDIKPSNILVDLRGNVWLTDFGLARLASTESSITIAGSMLGSPGFMSPEQWEAREDLDERADVFGLGATIHAALTLRLPYGTARIDSRTPLAPPPRGLLQALRSDYDIVLLKSLEPVRDLRYANGSEFAADWRRVRDGLYPVARRVGWARRLARRARNHRWGFGEAALVALVVVIVILAWRREYPPRIQPLVGSPSATATATVIVPTQPTGARVAMVPIDPRNGEFLPELALRSAPGAKGPARVEGVPPGDYLVVARDDRTGAFHEVYRHVPARGDVPAMAAVAGTAEGARFPQFDWLEPQPGTVELPRIVLHDPAEHAGMVRLEGSDSFKMGFDDPKVGLPAHPEKVDPFWLDARETTTGDYARSMGRLPESLRRALGNEQASEDAPITHVTHAEAVAYAERVGKRLMLESEYEFAATRGGASDFPWGDSAEPLRAGGEWIWPMGPVGRVALHDRTDTSPPILGLFSNVAEWTDSWLRPYALTIQGKTFRPELPASFREQRAVRGGPPGLMTMALPSRSTPTWQVSPRYRASAYRDQRGPGVGFRCARSATPRFLDEGREGGG